MAEFLSTLTSFVLKAGILALVANEVRGLVLAAPVLYAMYRAGGNWMALWLGFCALAGIAISVVAPLMLARKLNLLPQRG